jgi:hypothetical protein
MVSMGVVEYPQFRVPFVRLGEDAVLGADWWVPGSPNLVTHR